MVKPTKRPKRTKVTFRKVESFISCYQCPTCKVLYEGGGPRKNVTRFVCDCGQELIAN